jgi:hypothetical protein
MSVLRLVKARFDKVRLDSRRVRCHTFRGAGITAYLENDGKKSWSIHHWALGTLDDEAL